MIRPAQSALLVLLTSGVAIPSTLAAQTTFRSRATAVEVTGRVHTQFNTTSVTGERGSEFLIRRSRLTARITVDDFVTGVIQPDYGEGAISLKDAYLRLNFRPQFVVTFGQFKRPFDLFELTSSTQILVIERTGGVRGVDDCAGPGGTCSLSRLTSKLGYSDRDIGAMAHGAGGRLSYSVAVTNGTGQNLDDENGTKSYSGRIAVDAGADVTVAGHLGAHDYPNATTGGNDYAIAAGGDIEIGDFDGGWHIRAGAVTGQNWRNLDAAGDPSTFFGTQGIVTYRHALPAGRLRAVEPLARLSYGNPDTGGAGGGGVLLTPGVVLHFTGRNKIAANVDVWASDAGGTELAIRLQSYLHF